MTTATATRYIRGHKDGVETMFVKIPIKKLRLDRWNVRFKHIFKEQELTDAEIEQLIWEEADTKVLYNLIINSGGLSERPFVDENNVVKEGNRRIVCLRKIIRDIEAQKITLPCPRERFTEIECEVPVNSIAPLDMEILLARWHVKDKKPWAKLNQASHLYDMRVLRGLNYDEIAREVGLSKGKVLQCCKSFEWTNEYMQKYKIKNVNCWSFFEELYKKKELREWAMCNRDNLEKFYEWVNKGKFPMAIHIRELSLILFNPDKQLSRDLLKFFNEEDKNMPLAKLRLANYDPSLSSTFFKKLKSIREKLERMKVDEIKEIRIMPAKKKAMISLRDKLSEIIKAS